MSKKLTFVEIVGKYKNDHKIVIYMTLFEKGGVTSFWRQIIEESGSTMQWLVFSNFDNENRKFAIRPRYKNGIIWKSIIKTSRNFFKLLKEEKPDIIFLNGTLADVLILPVLLYLKLFDHKIKVIELFHNAEIYPNRVKSALNRYLLSMIGHLTHNNIFVSEKVASYWLCGGKIFNRPTRINKKSIIPKKLNSIGFLGRLSWEKGIDTFCAIASLYHEKDSSINWIVYGDGSLRKELEVKFPWISFRGWVEDTTDALASMDLCLVPSRFEGLGLVIFESLFVGTPVIAFKVGGIPEALASVPEEYITDSSVTAMTSVIDRFRTNYSLEYLNYFKYQIETLLH
jgi:glycosyltransferase involved in cell wall biosynthesis